MDHIKRADRLGAITRILTATPNRLHGYAEFCELFGAAKSTISEDIDIIANSISRFAEGRVETIAGASGGVRFRPLPSKKRMRETLNGLCARLSQPGRLLPGGFVYTSDLTSESDAVWSIGEILAAEFYDVEPDVVLTMETKGIPIAMSVAQMLDVPLIIARRDSRAYEGSAVKINYIAGNGVDQEAYAPVCQRITDSKNVIASLKETVAQLRAQLGSDVPAADEAPEVTVEGDFVADEEDFAVPEAQEPAAEAPAEAPEEPSV